MSKELEACFKEIYHEIEYVYDSKVCSKANKNWYNDIKHYDNIRGNVLTIQRYIEAIDNAEPSEALECLEKIIDNLDDYADFEIKQEANEYIDAIKQALLKAQEQKKYLKWEDLKFTKKAKEMRVKLGDTTYLMRYYKVNDHTNKVCISSFQFIEIYDIRFFNDLHLERIEE